MHMNRRFRRPRGGVRWRALRSRHFPQAAAFAVAGAVPLVRVAEGGLDWPAVWSAVQGQLGRRRYSQGTLRLYRQVLRAFRAYVQSASARGAITPAQQFRGFLRAHAAAGASWSWIGLNIAVLRTVFDKLGGLTLSRDETTPRRPHRLPPVVSDQDARRVLAAAPTLRDQFVFPGAAEGRGMSARNAERIVREAGRTAGVGGPFSGMTLRHSYALHALRRGTNIRALQEALGHQNPKTTLEYTRWLVPDAVSPFDRLGGVDCALPGGGPDLVPSGPAAPSPTAAGECPPTDASATGAAPAEPPALFEQPLSIEGLALPFPASDSGPWSRAIEFLRLLRLRVSDRFLATRRAVARGS